MDYYEKYLIIIFIAAISIYLFLKFKQPYEERRDDQDNTILSSLDQIEVHARAGLEMM